MKASPTVLVTGGSVRLGLAISAVLERRGWRVAKSSHRPDAAADLIADLSLPGACEALYGDCCRRFGGPPAAIVNNAALYRGEAAAVDAVNRAAPLRLAELLAESGGGAVVDILDARLLGGRAPGIPQDAAYVAGKLELARTLEARARRMARRGVRLNAVAPGAVFAPVGVREAADSRIAARPSGAEIGAAAALLLETPSIVGVILPVDGGSRLL